METVSGKGNGSGWAHLTTDTSGTFTELLPTPNPFGVLVSEEETKLTGTIKGDSSDKLHPVEYSESQLPLELQVRSGTMFEPR